MTKRIRPINALLKKGVRVLFKRTMEAIGCDLLLELAVPSVLVFPNWDAVENGSGLFRVHYDVASMFFVLRLSRSSPTAP